MTDQELRDLVAENSRSITRMQQETEKSNQEARKKEEERNKEAEKSRKEAEKSRKEVNTLLNKVGREIGWIGNTFGRFTEGLFLPSLEKILLKDFGLDTVAPRIQRRQNGSFVELDVLAFSNSEKNMAIVVEIKSKLRDDDIKAFLKQLANFPNLFPEHRDKKLFGMIAAVGISTEQKAAMEKMGLYVVRIKDDVFRVVSSKNFEPKDFGLKE